MCEQCVADIKFYGEPLEGIFLVRASKDGHDMMKDEWGLVICNDPFLIWRDTPTDEKSQIFGEILVYPNEGYKLVSGAIKKGYKETDNFSVWFFDYLGKWLKDHPEFPEKE